MKFGPGVRINWPKVVEDMEAKRHAAKQSMLEASLEVGMTSVDTWRRLRKGHGCFAETFMRLLFWLGTTDARPYLLMDSKGDPDW